MKYLHELFDRQVNENPQRPFLHWEDAIITMAMLDTRVRALEEEMLRLGVRRGDRVMVVAENCPEHIALILACSRIGAWSCGVNARMTGAEIAAFVRKADARIVYFTSGVSDVARKHAHEYSAVHSVLPALQRSAIFEGATAETGPSADAIAAVIFTSGTTGQPKGVLVSHQGLIKFGDVSCASRELTSRDKSYAYLPMTHIFGLGTVLATSLKVGASLELRSRFDPADVFHTLAHKGLTQLQGPPTMFVRLLSWLDEQGVNKVSAPALRYMYAGSAPMTLELKKAVEQRFPSILYHGYGLSEYAGALTLCKLGVKREDTCAGYLVDGGGLKIMRPDGTQAATGETGEIWMSGVGLMPGYFRDAQATAQVMREGGWYTSGDLGRMAEDGGLFVVGRLKEMIIRSGFNVYPGEIEAVLQACAGVEKAAVVGRQQADGNEEVIAFLEAKTGMSIDVDRIRALASEQLSPYKRPARYVVVPSMPMTHSGKILKRELLNVYPQEN